MRKLMIAGLAASLLMLGGCQQAQNQQGREKLDLTPGTQTYNGSSANLAEAAGTDADEGETRNLSLYRHGPNPVAFENDSASGSSGQDLTAQRERFISSLQQRADILLEQDDLTSAERDQLDSLNERIELLSEMSEQVTDDLETMNL